MFAQRDVARSREGRAADPAPRRESGQGYIADATLRAAIEQHAVERAISHYKDYGATSIEELGKPYDLKVVVGGVERHVEVKGSSGTGVESVQLTQGEVDHANSYRPTDLFIVDGIIVRREPGGGVTAVGGSVRLWADWAPAARSLRPTHLRYSLPLET
ncbi:hypothetical protein brsh051_20280 [Brooklawnia propionicigenes]|uniref:Protein NO VEIN C-terminal domain-containing protein n=1 Tax=Brooklawnia propionicigenes TaxID=3041175 RepID=A0AAN0K7C1_9ACTN|nr:DUF3883 domain-containing protein [Brooklawnia sp. SH051]BEH02747.1 hypothetical protein brsh051_20280 [Brooklawnia sp. SH051]